MRRCVRTFSATKAGMDYPVCVDAVSDAEREGQSGGDGDGESSVCMNNGRALRHHHCRNSPHRDMPYARPIEDWSCISAKLRCELHVRE
jgi:hypothetical protein